MNGCRLEIPKDLDWKIKFKICSRLGGPPHFAASFSMVRCLHLHLGVFTSVLHQSAPQAVWNGDVPWLLWDCCSFSGQEPVCKTMLCPMVCTTCSSGFCLHHGADSTLQHLSVNTGMTSMPAEQQVLLCSQSWGDFILLRCSSTPATQPFAQAASVTSPHMYDVPSGHDKPC